MDYLLIIDPQNDFMDLPDAALPVKGALDDMERLSSFIKNNAMDGVMVSLDSHSPYDIGHACFWVDKEGNPPAPFTVITSEDLVSGKFTTADPAIAGWARNYLIFLETRGRYKHTIWPNHCEPGTWGHQIPGGLLTELNQWSLNSKRPVDYIFKGVNPYTECYSAFEAEVPREEPSARKNIEMIQKLMKADRIFVAGEALSHCVKSSIESLTDYIPARKLVLLEDCMSPVSGFEKAGEDFLQKMKLLDAQVKKSTDYMKVKKCP